MNRDYQSSEDEDEDANVSEQKLLPSAKKKKKKGRQKSVEDNDDVIQNQQETIKQKKGKRDIAKNNTLQHEDEDDKPIVKSYGTIKTFIPPKRPGLDNRKIKPSGKTDDGSIQSSKHEQAIPMDEEHAGRSYSPPSYSSSTNPTDMSFLRSVSYRQAQQFTPPLVPYRPKMSCTLKNQDNINDDSSHYSEIANEPSRSGFSNRSYSKPLIKQTTSIHSDKQQDDDDTSIDIDEEEDQEKIELTKIQPTSLPNEVPLVSTAHNTTPTPSEKEAELNRIRRRKQLRFRWHFLYTILRNYHLFDLRKDVQGRLTGLYLQRSTLVDEQQFLAATTSIDESQHAAPLAKVGYTDER